MSFPTTNRQPSIDILRAIAIALMVVVHFVENLSGQLLESATTNSGYFSLWLLPTGFAAPIFTFLSGTSHRIWLETQIKRGGDDEAINKSTARRGLFLIGLGFVFNVLVWFPEETFNWDVLTLIGISTLAIGLLRSSPDGVVLLAACLIAILARPLQDVSGFSEYWTNGYYDPDTTLTDTILGCLVNGYFPVFPWLAFPLAGYALGPTIFHPDSKTSAAKPLLLLAVVMMLLSGLLQFAGQSSGQKPWTMFPASPAFIAGTMGFVLLAIVTTRFLIDLFPGAWISAKVWVTTLSRHSLSIYLLHHIAHLWPLWLFGIWNGQQPTEFWQNATSPAISLGLAIVFIFAAAFLFRWIDQRKVPTMETLMRWLCD